MKLNTEIKCREKRLHDFASSFKPTHYQHVSTLRSILAKLSFMLIPASVYGCSKTEASGVQNMEHIGTMLHILKSESPGAVHQNTLDVFAFEDDPFMRLDSYMRIDESDMKNVRMVTQSGEKVMFLCANSGRGPMEWAGVENYHSLEEIYADLEKESKNHPLMSGECRVEAGGDKNTDVGLSPLYAEVVVNSIQCDFSGKPYEGESIKDARIYLINVNARSSISGNNSTNPERFVNAGFLNPKDISLFEDPEIICRHLDEDICSSASYPEISLLCYPNTALTDGIGSPFTRLVIEGVLEGIRYYWPINVNRPPHGNGGVQRNCRYVYDIVIRNKGTDNPDVPVVMEEGSIRMNIASWKEQDDYGILF